MYWMSMKRGLEGRDVQGHPAGDAGRAPLAVHLGEDPGRGWPRRS